MMKKKLSYLTVTLVLFVLFYIVGSYVTKQQDLKNHSIIDTTEGNTHIKSDLKPPPVIVIPETSRHTSKEFSPHESNITTMNNFDSGEENTQLHTKFYSKALTIVKNNDLVLRKEVLENEPNDLIRDQQDPSLHKNLADLLGESDQFFEQLIENKQLTSNRNPHFNPDLDNYIREEVLSEEPSSMYLSPMPNDDMDLQERLKEDESFLTNPN